MNQGPPRGGAAAPQFPTTLARWLDSRSATRLLAVLLVALVIGMAFPYAHKVRHHRSAFDRWYSQILEMYYTGTNIAETYQYPNPPIMAILLLPLVQLKPFAGAMTWYALKAILTAVALFWLFRWVGNCRPTNAPPPQPSPARGEGDVLAPLPASGRGWGRGRLTPSPLAGEGWGGGAATFPTWGVVLAVLLSLRPILGDLEHGNVNLFILFLVLASLTLLHCRRDVLAGLILALAIACKLTPALFLPYLVWKRAWRALAGSAAGLALFFWPGFVPATVLGWDQNQQHLASWYHEMVMPYLVEGKVTSELANQSLPGVVARLATHSPADSRWEASQDRFVPTRYANLFDLSSAQARLLVKGCLGLFVLLVVWCCRTPLTGSGGWRLSAEFGLVMVGMLLFSERTWKHHCVMLVVPFAVLCYSLSACSPGPLLRSYLIATLAAVTGLIASTSVGLLPETWAETAQVYGAYVWANFLLIAALAVLLLQRRSGCVE